MALMAALLGPVGAIALAIGGVSMAVFTAIKHWDDLKRATRWAIDDMLGVLSKLLESPFFVGVSAMFIPWFTIPATIIKHWEPVEEFFRELALNIKNATNLAFGFFGLKSPFGKEAKIAKIQLPGDKDTTPRVPVNPLVPPNASEERSRQTPLLKGMIKLAGAPKGTTFETETRHAPPVQTEVLGANP
jgi:hypothetical protein